MKVCFIPIKLFGAKLLALSLMIKNLCKDYVFEKAFN